MENIQWSKESRWKKNPEEDTQKRRKVEVLKEDQDEEEDPKTKPKKKEAKDRKSTPSFWGVLRRARVFFKFYVRFIIIVDFRYP